ncbi:hypothetical protein HATV-3_gp69 [Haloarcula tailed virus 3]|jgi:hypothetical protein|uniref:Uncharacterized protein n=1 Tax=Haloarcula tailed virus 3 TaxID=2877990 RepID=A0AAE8Y0U3_9CAUD|nr:hypothetical protein M1M35_gp69 [Haloarcula tailed virus 3]UBF23419.1 hypothetical protein HATV-3_gp69 [Haloarcula tailed virus 3]
MQDKNLSDVSEGDYVEVEIVNDCPLGGATQQAGFTVEETTMTEIRGTDESWGDECVISGFGTDTISYSDAGKSGEVDEVRIMETTDDNVPIHGSGTVVA